MNKINLLIVLLIFTACRQESKTSSQSAEILLSDSIPQNTQLDKKPEKPQADTIPTGNFYDAYPAVLKELASKFHLTNMRRYDCTDIEPFIPGYNNYSTTENLVEIDSLLGKQLFGKHLSDEYGSFEGFFLFSLEKPVMNFYPITLIQPLGVAERPMLLVLFDKNGKYVNSIEVADAYGEQGGCMNSYFINDSTLVREYEFHEYDIKETGDDELIVTKEQDTIIIHKDGSYSSLEKINKRISKTKDSLRKNPKLYFIKWNDKDTLVSLNFFTNERFGASLDFNYPTLAYSDTRNPASSPETQILTFSNDTIKVELSETKYHPGKHHFKENVKKNEVFIDGQKAFGFDTGTKETEIQSEIESITIVKGNASYRIPKKYYANWFNAHLDKKTTEIYLLPGNRIIIEFSGSDAAGAYLAGLIIKDNKILKKLTFTGW